MDWDKLRVFHAVAEAGSLTHAGDVLHLSQSAVSRQIRGLEESVGATLFHRHARGLLLTEQGEILFNTTRSMSAQLTETAARIRDARDLETGTLRVTTTTGFGTLWLAPRLGRFFDQHPKMSLDLILSEGVLDLPMREADVAIRLREPQQAELIRKPLMDVRMRLYASPGYVAQHGAPDTLEELESRRFISFTPDGPQPSPVSHWLAQQVKQRQSTMLTMNNYFGVLQAAEAGLGIAALPDYLGKGNDAIVNVAPELFSEPFTVFFTYPEELRSSQRVIAFREFVIDEVKKFQK